MSYLIRSTTEIAPLAPGESLSKAHGQALGVHSHTVVALLDAAAHHQVPEMLTGDADDARCLWQGKAEETFGEYAPWIASLGAESATLRHMMTQGDAFWHLWGAWPGVIFKARRGMPSLRHHLRRLSRVVDGSGNAYYLRFWEPTVAGVFWSAFADDAEQVAWRFGSDVAAVTWPSDSGLEQVVLPEPMDRERVYHDMISDYRPLFRAARWDRFVGRVSAGLKFEGEPFDGVPHDEVERLCSAARSAGYRKEAAIWDAVRATVLLDALGYDIRTQAELIWKDYRPSDDRSAARQLLKHARSVATRVKG